MNDGEEREVDPLVLHFATQAGETFEGGDGFAVYDLAGGDDRTHYRGGDHAFLLGGSGDDRLESNGVNDVIMGGSGDDTINAMGRAVSSAAAAATTSSSAPSGTTG